jgi:hypothetical protein
LERATRLLGVEEARFDEPALSVEDDEAPLSAGAIAVANVERRTCRHGGQHARALGCTRAQLERLARIPSLSTEQRRTEK